MKLTKAGMADVEAAFAADNKADKIYFDEDLPGFGLRLRRGSKRRVWVIQYDRCGQTRRLTLGPLDRLTPEEARKIAKRKLAEATLDGDPAGEKQEAKAKARETLRVIIDQYLRDRQADLRPTSLAEVTRYLNKSWKPLHRMPIDKIATGAPSHQSSMT